MDVRLVLIFKCDRDPIKDCGIIGTGIVVDEQIADDDKNWHDNHHQPNLRNDVGRNAEPPQLCGDKPRFFNC